MTASVFKGLNLILFVRHKQTVTPDLIDTLRQMELYFICRITYGNDLHFVVTSEIIIISVHSHFLFKKSHAIKQPKFIALQVMRIKYDS